MPASSVATGNLDAEAHDVVPASEWPKMIRSSRLYLLTFLGLIAWCLAIGSILPTRCALSSGINSP